MLDNKSKIRVGILQLTCGDNPEDNLEKIYSFLPQVKMAQLDWLFLPEFFYAFAPHNTLTKHIIDGDNYHQDPHFQKIVALAQKAKVFLLGGSAVTRLNQSHIVNRSYNFDPTGNLIGVYDKMHLFASANTNEAEHFTPGQVPLLLSIQNYHVGIALCFDLRFNGLFWHYQKRQAHIISISSAFTVPTGKAHWHLLVRARAIETQSFVIAADQWGQNHGDLHTFGHSLIVDPWGNILADGLTGEKLITAELDLDLVASVRAKILMPITNSCF